jgi:alkylation response protein AidB-like acyl-CoA dehydrogenase
MTEILGGSDVRASTHTIAKQIENNKYALYGLKWFTSAIDADVTFTLAKIQNKDESIDDSPTLFFVKVRNEDGQLNNINPTRLKDKMGTRQLPTAELILEGTMAEIASKPKQGIQNIMNLANITRLHNITSSVAFMRRIIALVEDYSYKRKVFSYQLFKQPLHIIAYSNMKAILEGNFLMLFQLVKMQNKLELNPDYKNKNIFRMLLPMGKAFAGRCSEEVCIEGIQCFGGVGYMENSHIPVILRDTIVTSIWEGTINVLSFDFIKVKKTISNSYQSFLDDIAKRLNLMYIIQKINFKILEIMKKLRKIFQNYLKLLKKLTLIMKLILQGTYYSCNHKFFNV